MEWFKLAAKYADDPAVVAAGEEAEVLFVRALAYCADAESGGFLPEKIVARLTPTKTRKRIESLVRNGLWIEVPGGYRVRSWNGWQSELEALAARRRSDRNRKRAQREREAAARAEQDAEMSRDSPADASRDIRDPSRDGHVTVTAMSALEKGEVEKPTNQSAPNRPSPAVPGPRLGGGSDAQSGTPTDPVLEAGAVALLAALDPPHLRPGRKAASQLARDIAELLALGWPPAILQSRMTDNPPSPIGNLGGFLRSRLPEPTRYATPRAEPEDRGLPVWCGECNQSTRCREDSDGMPSRCPECHPVAIARKEAAP